MNSFYSVTYSLLFLSNLIAAQQQIDYGSCPIPEMEFGFGIDPGKNEFRFLPKNRQGTIFQDQSSALNPRIIANFLCTRLKNECKAPEETNAKCEQAKTDLDAAPTGGSQADAFNRALGIETNYAASNNAPVSGNAVGNGGNSAAEVGNAQGSGDAAAGDGSAQASGNVAAVVSNAQTTGDIAAVAPVSAPDTGVAPAAGSSSFGSCPIPEMEFGFGIDPGKNEFRFLPKNRQGTIFQDQSSALNPRIIAEFLCTRLKNECTASADTNAKCSQAKKALSAAPKGGAQADAFNSALGIRTSYAISA